jgi:hypothetical protein
LVRGISLGALALAAVAAGCDSQQGEGDSQDDLQALLHDGDLTHLTQSALGAASVGGAPGTGTAGANGGGGGATGGAAGGASDGGVVITGVGGFAGTIGGFGGTGGVVMTGAGGFAGSFDGGAAGSGGFGGAGGRFDGGMGGFGGFFQVGPFGQWSFDDCNPGRTNLFDSGPLNNTAFRAVAVTCSAGVAGQAVTLAQKEDIVYVPDQPNFTFDHGVTVAGWFNPDAVGKTRTLFRKRDKDTSSIALVLNGGKFQFVINLGDGRAASVTAPTKAKVGVFQHVAGTYDGAVLNLYVNGALVTTFNVSGSIPPGPGPFLMGNDGSERRFDGSIDNAFFDGRALSAQEILALTCIRHTATLAVNPRASAPTPPNVPASFDIALTNNDSASCTPSDFEFLQFNFFSGVTIDPPQGFPQLLTIAPGATGHFTMTATADDSVEAQTFPLFFEVFGFQSGFFDDEVVDFVVAEPTGCHVNTSRELMIKDLSVVDDPARTTGSGVWTFKHLAENMAPTPDAAPDMVEAMLNTFTTTQTINGFSVGPRPGMQALILSSWPRTPDGKLDLSQAPLKLQAIVDRFDLRNLNNGDAGEGRFVFGFQPAGSFFPLQATMIFEYKLPAATDDDVMGWANAWHNLGSMQFSPAYNDALQAITERFAGRGARPGHPNDNAINAVRTNEIDFSDNGIWQLREFNLSPSTGLLVPATIKLTPDRSFNNSDTLATFINANQAAIIAETHTVPDTFQGQSFLAGAVFNDLTTWFAPGVDPEARHHFAVNTCNGCHSSQETNVGFLQISPRFPGSEAILSPFLTGTTVSDPVTGLPRMFNDLGRRNADLKGIVCGTPMPMPTGSGGIGGGSGGSGGASGAGGAAGRGGFGGAMGGFGGSTGMSPPPPPRPAQPIPNLRVGISRVH